MMEWQRFVQPVAKASNSRRTQSSIVLLEGNLLVSCGEAEALVGVSGDERQVIVRLNGESHHYDRALVRRIVVDGARGNHDIELDDQTFDMLVVAHGARTANANNDDCGDLHELRAKRHRADDFGLI
jgi:hypothetical protein